MDTFLFAPPQMSQNTRCYNEWTRQTDLKPEERAITVRDDDYSPPNRDHRDYDRGGHSSSGSARKRQNMNWYVPLPSSSATQPSLKCILIFLLLLCTCPTYNSHTLADHPFKENTNTTLPTCAPPLLVCYPMATMAPVTVLLHASGLRRSSIKAAPPGVKHLTASPPRTWNVDCKFYPRVVYTRGTWTNLHLIMGTEKTLQTSSRTGTRSTYAPSPECASERAQPWHIVLGAECLAENQKTIGVQGPECASAPMHPWSQAPLPTD
jgi:hypothetical protein